MVKSSKRVSQNIGGSKRNLLAERLKSTNLEKVMIVPIEIGKSNHKALLADYFGSIFKEPFEFHSSQEGINFLHNTISKVSKEYQIENIFISLEATGHYYQKPALSISELGYSNLFMLDNLLPGISELSMFKDSLWHPASLEFFAKYPNVCLISRLRPHNIVEFFHRRGRRIVPEDAHHLIRWTKQTFNQYSPTHLTKQEILRSLLLELKELFEKIVQLEVESLGYLVQLPAVLLLSIDYIGPTRAAEFAGEITPFEQYSNSRALIKGAGLDSTTFQSSMQEAKNHPISKKGSRSLRYISIDIADALMRHNDCFAFFANQLMERGKSKDCACIATATRFMRVAFHREKNKCHFNHLMAWGLVKTPWTRLSSF